MPQLKEKCLWRRINGGFKMGLKFQREDSLDKMFEEFAFLPEDLEKKEEEKNKALQRFLEPQPNKIEELKEEK